MIYIVISDINNYLIFYNFEYEYFNGVNNGYDIFIEYLSMFLLYFIFVNM